MKNFWSKVDKTPGLGPKGDCWEWKAGISTDGYGKFWYEGKTVRAHRMSYFLKHGRMPYPQALHHCDNRICVNPDHLFEGTCADNHKDRNEKERQARGNTHGKSILTEDLVRNDVIPSLKNGESCASIGKRLGVSLRAIHYIKCKRNWKHVA